MDSNKDEALRCVNIAKEAIVSGNKPRALKFIGMAQRLNKNLSMDDLLSACDNINGNTNAATTDSSHNMRPSVSSDEVSNGGVRSYNEEHVQLVRKVTKSEDYYEILGVEKSCSVEEIRKGYRKISLKVHPDKNKAPGSEEAFKKVSKAFVCLSNDDSRRQYDQTGLVDEFEHNQQSNVPRRRKRDNGRDMYYDNFNPDEIFRSFFEETDMSSDSHVCRCRTNQQRESFLQILPILVMIWLACLLFCFV